MIKLLAKFLGGAAEAATPVPMPLGGAIAADARRFAEWAGADGAPQVRLRAADGKLDALRAEREKQPIPDHVLSDAAAFFGEAVREAFGGEWQDNPTYGIVLARFGGIDEGKLLPLSVLERKWKRGPQFSLAEYFATLPARLEAERRKVARPPSVPSAAELRGLMGPAATERAAWIAAEFRTFWMARFRISLPPTLTGVRELDGFLRSHYEANFLPDAALVAAGFFTGEVCRGLFGGVWNFATLDSLQAAPLAWPEIEYYPVGRIFKMMTEQPAGDALDEYVRLVPSARSAMRKDRDQGPASP